jgi:hypothetical protein
MVLQKIDLFYMKNALFFCFFVAFVAPCLVFGQKNTRSTNGNDPAFCREMLDSAKAALAARAWNRASDYCEAALPLCAGLNEAFSGVLDSVRRGIVGEKEMAISERKRADNEAALAIAQKEKAQESEKNSASVRLALKSRDVAYRKKDYYTAFWLAKTSFEMNPIGET